MFVIGTAGHVDHGKSALVRALTGIDPDRLPEEKAREMTIDLGFAWLRLPSGIETSIVDVPGHERFLRNMLAGVGGINLALLVVAADEGVMPQTREHLAVLDLLDVKHGVLVITKKDLVDDDWLELVAADVREVVAGTCLAQAPLVPCSAVTGEGLEELLAIIAAELARVPPPRDVGRPRLTIDRVFTVAGFGTVVTGTLIDGSLAVGQEVDVLPGGLRARIRGLQTHRQKIERALPGSRTAVNLAGLSPDELSRGMVVTTPGWLSPTTAVDVRLRAVSYLPHPIRHNLHVTFYTGAAEVEGTVRLLDRDALGPGEDGWAQVRLAEPVAVVRGDGFIIRTPNDTVGGGKVVDIHALRHRRRHEPTLRALAALQEGSPQEALAALLARLEPCDLATLEGQSSFSPDEVRAAVKGLLAAGRIVALGGNILHTQPTRARAPTQW
ncbi:MAG TPA: selenocysteine-specific translation elongation factor, partial [Dehalococcoidia bacterium]|nr:selenocysteine-specific translation elongation factor [Dehalococcoidia bacterium]